MLLLSFSEKEKLGKPKEEIGNLKMDLNICILVISRYNICNLNICILVILRCNVSNLNICTLNICIFDTIYLYLSSVSIYTISVGMTKACKKLMKEQEEQAGPLRREHL